MTLDGWMLKPPDFDRPKKYPVIVYVYGEPAGQTVTDSWGGNGGCSIARSPTPATSSCRSTTVARRRRRAPPGARSSTATVGDLSSKEQAAAVAALRRRGRSSTWIASAIWGWSGGGSNTLNAMFRFPDVYKVGVSVAPVPDQRLYDTIYQERYMGLPQDNADGYRVGSPIDFARGPERARSSSSTARATTTSTTRAPSGS